MAKENSTKVGGSSTLPILGIVFIVLKLTGNIDWSWWWVLAPFWGGLAIVMAFFALYVAVKVWTSK